MKILTWLILLSALSGCGVWDRGVASVTGIAHTCVDGVMYLQFTSGASVAYLPNGQIRGCK